jgi:hypothetical protein
VLLAKDFVGNVLGGCEKQWIVPPEKQQQFLRLQRRTERDASAQDDTTLL